MMTTMAALMGTLPIALGQGAGAESRRPLGIAVVGGLAFSQLITLYMTPVVYTYLDALQQRLGRRKARARGAERGAGRGGGGGPLAVEPPLRAGPVRREPGPKPTSVVYPSTLTSAGISRRALSSA